MVNKDYHIVCCFVLGNFPIFIRFALLTVCTMFPFTVSEFMVIYGNFT